MPGVRFRPTSSSYPLVAQLEEVPRLERGGWGFESTPRGPIAHAARQAVQRVGIAQAVSSNLTVGSS